MLNINDSGTINDEIFNDIAYRMVLKISKVKDALYRTDRTMSIMTRTRLANIVIKGNKRYKVGSSHCYGFTYRETSNGVLKYKGKFRIEDSTNKKGVMMIISPIRAFSSKQRHLIFKLNKLLQLLWKKVDDAH